MDKKAPLELSHKVMIPNNTFGIFVHLDTENQMLQVEVGDFVTKSLEGTKEYDAMACIITILTEAVDNSLCEFMDIDSEYELDKKVEVKFEGDNVIPFPDLNKRKK
tara:strand:- start:3335 stop:3652 length:318 start_codon:yes stop_codon:yes gene_type:complete